MHLRRRLALLVSLLAALAASAPAAAPAADYVVRPAQTYSTGAWSIAPTAATADSVLAEPILAPTAPAQTGGYLFGHGNGPIVAEVGLQNPAVPDGYSVTGARARAYLATGSGRSLTLELRSGTTLLGMVFVPAGWPSGWYDTVSTAKPTVSQLSDLRVRATIGGSGPSTDVKLFAAYGVVSADPPAPGAGDANPTAAAGAPTTPLPADGATSPTVNTTGSTTTAAPAVSLPFDTLTAAANGVLAVPITCQLSAGCTGTVTTRLVGPGFAARSARRHKVAKNTFHLGAGQSREIAVRLDRRTTRFIRRRGRGKIAVTVAIDGAPAVTKQLTVVQRRTPGRR